MSTEIQFDTVACPKCNSRLLPECLDDVAVLCANCRTSFVPAGRRTIQRTSRKAIISLVLGLLSLVGWFLTGIPAIWLGIVAFRDIGRTPRSLKGKSLAVGGIATGTVFGLMCGTCIGVSALMPFLFGPNLITETEDPQAVAEIAGRLADFEAPRGTEPLEAMEMGMFSTRTIVYAGDPRPDYPLIVVMQLPQGTIRQQIKAQIEHALRNKDRRNSASLTAVEFEELEFTIRGQTVTVYKSVSVDSDRGDRFRDYVAEIPNAGGGLIFAALMTPDEPGVSSETETVALTEDEVREFFESFQ